MTAYASRTQSIRRILPSRGRALLSHLDVELTERCNNRCVHCYNRTDDPNAEGRELSTDKIREVLGEAASLGCLSVRFTGGEPLMREDFSELYRAARRLGLQVDVTTNATLITSELARTFAEITPLGRIEATLYGARKETYEAVTRVEGSFERALRGLEHLTSAGVPFTVRGVSLPQNRKERAAFEAGAALLTPDNPPLFTVLLDLRARRDSLKKNREIRSLRIPPGQCMSQLAFHPEAYLRDARRLLEGASSVPETRLFSCGVGNGSACLDAYGTLQACFLLRHPDTTCDLTASDCSLEEALRDRFPELAQQEGANAAYLERCAWCFLRGLCEQCPARSWMENGTLDSPVEYLCEVTHEQGRYLGLLSRRERAWEVEQPERRLAILFDERGPSSRRRIS